MKHNLCFPHVATCAFVSLRCIFSLSLSYFLIVSYCKLSNVCKSKFLCVRLGNPKAAAHVAVRPSVLVTVKLQ